MGSLKSLLSLSSWALSRAFPVLAQPQLPSQPSVYQIFFLPLERQSFPSSRATACGCSCAVGADAGCDTAAAGKDFAPGQWGQRVAGSGHSFANTQPFCCRPAPEEALKWGESLEKLLLHKCECLPLSFAFATRECPGMCTGKAGISSR